ncbi:MAG: conjugative transposon TraN protein [Chitinophagaceae bacterium]|nr:conjugative transposon TraN protein [Chitinophagaceae bacterium]
MKVFILFTLCAIQGYGQRVIEPLKLEVSDTKTSNIIFPSSITSIDRGIEKLLVQKSTDKILRVKAEESFTGETNLTVITHDGKLYSFLVVYKAIPAYLNINMGSTSTVNTDSAIVANTLDVSKMKPFLYGARYSSGHVTLQLDGFYVINDLVFCKLKIKNRSSIGYIIAQLRIYFSNKKYGKRTALQERELQPVYISGDSASVKEKSDHEIIIACTPFTIPPDQSLVIALIERGGGRNLFIKVKGNYVTRARLIENSHPIFNKP